MNLTLPPVEVLTVPLFCRYIGHACYIFMIPLQFLVECINTRWFSLQQQEKASWKQHLKNTTDFCRKQLAQSVFELEDRVRGKQRHHMSFMLRTGLLLSILFTIPAYLWYVSVNLISMSTLTVVFNTGCFWAYIFSIFMLGDPVRLEKFLAVGLSVFGVVIMAFSQEDDDSPTNDVNPSLSSFVGLGVAVVAALTYGFYEVTFLRSLSPFCHSS